MTKLNNQSGHCLCGAVQFTIKEAEPVRMAQCHCKDCQRASGGGHMSLAFFKAEDIDVRGETASFAVTADSGNINTRHYCPKCGGRLFGENSARPGLRAVTVGSFDDNSWFEPQAVVYVSRREPWDKTSTEVANFDEMPPMPPSK